MKNLRVGILHTVLWPILLFLLLTSLSLWAASPAIPSSPPDLVVDLADIIKPDLENELVSALRELEEKTSAQMVILTINSLDGEAIESLSLHTAEQWQLGQKGKDNGLLLTVALKDRKYRFETGYGMESILPDSLLGSIGRGKMIPLFKEGKYDQGIAAATKEVLTLLAKYYNVQLGSMQGLSVAEPVASSHAWSIKDIMGILGLGTFGIVFLILFIIGFRNSSRSSYNYSSSDHDSWSNSSGSSSWSSSSDSDFSGGGGDFGGGGDSGDW